MREAGVRRISTRQTDQTFSVATYTPDFRRNETMQRGDTAKVIFLEIRPFSTDRSCPQCRCGALQHEPIFLIGDNHRVAELGGALVTLFKMLFGRTDLTGPDYLAALFKLGLVPDHCFGMCGMQGGDFRPLDRDLGLQGLEARCCAINAKLDFEGERAELAKSHANRVANAFHGRLEAMSAALAVPSGGLVVTQHG